MVQFKPYFLGEAIPPRPADHLPEVLPHHRHRVGRRSRHLTFFEMLGNFCIGDYFKKEAIDLGLGVRDRAPGDPAEKLWITVYLDDDEAVKFWRSNGRAGRAHRAHGRKGQLLGPGRRLRPLRPVLARSTTISARRPAAARRTVTRLRVRPLLEIWNLVFMQYNQDEARPPHAPAPAQHRYRHGTGAASPPSCRARSTVYETDLFDYLLMARTRSSPATAMGADEDDDRAMRVVAEHCRAITFLIADGVMPANEGRGYVLRRLLRRAALFGRRLGLEKPFLVPTWPSRSSTGWAIDLSRTARAPRFHHRTSSPGGGALRHDPGYRHRSSWRIMAAQGEPTAPAQMTGEEAFKLYDTYGFPLDLTTRSPRRTRLRRGRCRAFERDMARQRENARSAQQFASAPIEPRSRPGSTQDRVSRLRYLPNSHASSASGARWRGGGCRRGRPGGWTRAGRHALLWRIGGQVGDTGELCGRRPLFHRHRHLSPGRPTCSCTRAMSAGRAWPSATG